MKLSKLGEFGLIDLIRKGTKARSAIAPIGIGDDAAALLFSPDSLVLTTTDMLLEGVHFDRSFTDLYSLGWKSAAVNISDIAAMGGTPRFCLTALGIPSTFTIEQITAFYRGLNACLKKFKAMLVGGDTCRSEQGLVVNVTMLGEAKRTEIIRRKKAIPGDIIYVTGTIGDSAAGLELLKRRVKDQRSECKAIKSEIIRQAHDGEHRRTIGNPQFTLIRKHLRPVPRVLAGGKLAASGIVSAMIDVSDGLSSDLAHICEESGVGAEVFAAALPLSRELKNAACLSRPAIEYALSGGEDYELLFTAPFECENTIKSLRVSATAIGAITRKRGMRLISKNGAGQTLVPQGFDHFRTVSEKVRNR